MSKSIQTKRTPFFIYGVLLVHTGITLFMIECRMSLTGYLVVGGNTSFPFIHNIHRLAMSIYKLGFIFKELAGRKWDWMTLLMQIVEMD